MDISGNKIENSSGSSEDPNVVIDAITMDNEQTPNTITISTENNKLLPSDQLNEIMDNGFVANESVLNSMNNEDKYDWEDDYFKQFDWLSDSTNILDDNNDIVLDGNNDIVLNMQSIPQNERLTMFIDCCKLIESQNLMIMNNAEYEKTEDLETAQLYMYYVSLENDKLLLHVDFKKNVDTIISDCEKLYEFARINAPIRIVYISEVRDLYDVDKDVKLFMNMFGIENTRGGSYTDVELPDFLMKTLLHEKTITDVYFYINQTNKLEN